MRYKRAKCRFVRNRAMYYYNLLCPFGRSVCLGRRPRKGEKKNVLIEKLLTLLMSYLLCKLDLSPRG